MAGHAPEAKRSDVGPLAKPVPAQASAESHLKRYFGEDGKGLATLMRQY